MRFVTLYLAGYAILVLGALAALWHGGALQQLPATWILVGLLIAAVFGVMLAVTAMGTIFTRE